MKNYLLLICKFLGLFELSRRLTKNKLQILCYHAFSIEDEHKFRGSVFMTREKFESRMSLLKNKGFNIVPLGQAVDQLKQGTLKPNSVAITIDDGFFSVLKIAKPILSTYQFPATLYVTSYYLKHPNPVFRLAVQYITWKSEKTHINLFDLGITTDTELTPIDDAQWLIIDHFESNHSEQNRYEALKKLSDSLCVDIDPIEKQRLFHICTEKELFKLQSDGVDIQLHTHRHRMPNDASQVSDEIQANITHLEKINEKLDHFCYPSGVWKPSHWPVLKSLNIKTATTCVNGMNDRNTHIYALKRLLDREDLPDIEFEAEIMGFKEICRSTLKKIR